MGVEGVFAVGVSGMGPALSPEGERIVAEKMEVRDRMLDELKQRGLNVGALAHCHRTRACNHGPDYTRENAHDQGKLSFDKLNDPAQELAAAHARLRAQERELEHLRHHLAVQENKVLLLRQALKAAHEPTAETR